MIVKVAQLIRLKVFKQMANLKVYASKSFYPDTAVTNGANPDFFQDINILEHNKYMQTPNYVSR